MEGCSSQNTMGLQTPVPSSELTTLESKRQALKERKEALDGAKKEVDRLVSVHVDGVDLDAIPMSVGCFGRLAGSCSRLGFFSRPGRTRLATHEAPTAAASGASDAATATATAVKHGVSRSLQGRLFGMKRGVAEQGERIQSAIQMVEQRLESVRDRAAMQRQRAVALSQAGKKAEALRELKKAKATDRQILAAQQALDALEQQSDLLSQSMLQRDLASALASTNSEVKSKTRGLLEKAEKATDESQELRDAAEDVAAVFEGLAPTHDNDEDELLEELEELVEVNAPVSVAESAQAPAQHHQPQPAMAPGALVEVPLNAFPTAPTSAIGPSAMASSGL